MAKLATTNQIVVVSLAGIFALVFLFADLRAFPSEAEKFVLAP